MLTEVAFADLTWDDMVPLTVPAEPVTRAFFSPLPARWRHLHPAREVFDQMPHRPIHALATLPSVQSSSSKLPTIFRPMAGIDRSFDDTFYSFCRAP